MLISCLKDISSVMKSRTKLLFSLFPFLLTKKSILLTVSLILVNASASGAFGQWSGPYLAFLFYFISFTLSFSSVHAFSLSLHQPTFHLIYTHPWGFCFNLPFQNYWLSLAPLFIAASCPHPLIRTTVELQLTFSKLWLCTGM